ncbi:hypothetical protein AMELA_G00292920 [Ameiurus melas]|uniref:Uncharacterized protein n=1 Tax=Ameiurus melas TaxID=219545 RepID=A0A7J5ZIE2_AMEME|nr:hypothetical protein AMELA_G00292920 [Ameiurus melas]
MNVDQDPFWNAGDVPESRTSDPEKEEEELDAMLNLVSEMQDYSVGYDHLIDQDPFWNAGDVPDSRTSDPEKEEEELDAILNLVSEMQVR